MQPVSCPGCGAPVQFKSAASVMVVCQFCNTTLLKDADSVSNLGKMSEVLEDYSPLQIGTSGQFAQRSFSLIGRIQLQYSDGYWNEWYALFDDGSNGWLSDASGQYTMTSVRATDVALPLFEKLVPGHVMTVSGQVYATSDVRTARCTGGQGELPFKVGQGWVAKVADFRSADRFLSLDYSDPGPPKVYIGQAVQLADLKPQLLRDTDQIKDAAGRFHGKVTALSCPSCGAPVSSVAGITVHIVCPSCHAEVDTSGAVAKVLAAGAAVDAVRFTLALGSEAVIGGNHYTILGAMRRTESDDGSTWSEYLLYSPQQKFIWLIETDEGWQRAEVLDRWPGWDGAGHANLDGMRFEQSARYSARVVFAAGSFNWRVSVGDVTEVNEYSGGSVRLAAESTSEELTWSRSQPAPLDQVRAWFGGHVHADVVPHPAYTDTARKILIGLALVNAIPLLFVTSSVLPYALLAAAGIYLPAYFLDRLDAKGQ
jgi:Domain of unknown function (DUF4178)